LFTHENNVTKTPNSREELAVAANALIDIAAISIKQVHIILADLANVLAVIADVAAKMLAIAAKQTIFF